MNDSSPPQGAQAVLRAVSLLKLFTSEQPEMSLAQLSQASGLNKTTTHRLLRALQSQALIDKNASTGSYSLGAGLMALGVQALASSDLRRRVRPMLKMLARETGETATLEVPVEDSMLILDEVAGRHVVAAAGNIGTRWPMHATSTGKVLLAFEAHRMEALPDSLPALAQRTMTSKDMLAQQLVEIRKRGFAESTDELEDGFAAVATVIRGALGDVQGALSIGGPSQRLGPAKRAELGAALCRAAARLRPEY
ncbi:MAG: IclR family transcriptional regulator [Gammaproteobacteria bacterium]|nr:IclR family transcriptional regulator [Gammaproteobacteria bacterium]MDH4253048.1 IclR family transcriptional regulator [Gammaproteobacteria bacterium]MDH5308530.1 IclR family transcriptional regulator [Gammaproteobacteria bacterium]